MPNRNLKLLVIEDNEDDERLILRALLRVDRNMDVQVLRDGAQAVDRLCGSGSDLPLPDMILLDWKLSKVMGAEVLRRVRKSDRCKDLVVVAFSSSDNAEDRLECAYLQGNAFVTKPVEYYKFLAAIEGILDDYAPKMAAVRSAEGSSVRRVRVLEGQRESRKGSLEPDAADMRLCGAAA
jgi:CheY-like chemotaxis protein